MREVRHNEALDSDTGAGSGALPAAVVNPDETRNRDAAGGLCIIGIVDGQGFRVMSGNGNAGYIEIKWFYAGGG